MTISLVVVEIVSVTKKIVVNLLKKFLYNKLICFKRYHTTKTSCLVFFTSK